MKLQSLRNILRLFTTVSTVAATVVSCTESETEGVGTASKEKGEVIIAVRELSEHGVRTRTTIIGDASAPAEEGGTAEVRWCEGDDFALWATGEQSTDEYKNMRFTYLGSKYSEGTVYFSGFSVPKMAEGTYTYRAFSPCPDEKNIDLVNDRVSYEIPSWQSGVYENSRLDIMTASAERSSELVRDTYNYDLDLSFRHETHALRITIPADRNRFGHIIERVEIEFPQPVAGRMTFDARTGELVETELTENIIDVVLDEEHRINAFEGGTLWVFTAPATVSGEVRFTAFGRDGEISENWMSDLPSIAREGAFTEFERGVITPVTLGLSVGVPVTWIEYFVGDESRLGEKVQSLNLALPEGLHAADRRDSDGVFRVKGRHNGRYRAAFRTEELQTAMEGVGEWDFAAVFESEHALVPPYAEDVDKFAFSNEGIAYDDHNGHPIDFVPYLFEEDFNTAESFHSDDKYITGSTSGNQSYRYLFLNGWSGGRIGIQNGVLRLASRREGSVILSRAYGARVDSAPMSNIKPDVTAKLNIQYDYGTDRWGGTLSGITVTQGRDKGDTNTGLTVHYGYINEPSIHNSGDTTVDEEIGSFYTTETHPDGDIDAGYSYLIHQGEFQIPNALNTTRITWYTIMDIGNNSNGNNTYWLYLDNIKVSIVSE